MTDCSVKLKEESDSFTHGTSEQRYYWFKTGFDTGNPEMCNTFKAGAGPQ